MEHGQPDEASELDRPLDVDTSLILTGKIIYVDIYFKGTTERITLRIPESKPVDSLNDNFISYDKVLDAVDGAFQIGSEGHLQLPHHPSGQNVSTMFYALVGNLLGVFVHPPREEILHDE